MRKYILKNRKLVLFKRAISFKCIELQNKAILRMSDYGMLAFASGFAFQLFCTQYLCEELVVMAQKPKGIKKYVSKAFKINPRAATRGLFLSRQLLNSPTT
jgi:hypothetical protein